MVKLEVLEGILKDTGARLVVATRRPHLTYIFQTSIPPTYERPLILAHTPDRTLILAPRLEEPRLKPLSERLGLEAHFYDDGSDPLSLLSRHLGMDLSPAVLEHGISHSQYLRLYNDLGRPVDRGPLENLIAPYRLRKDYEEVSRIGEAIRLLKEAYRLAEKVLEEGVSEVEASLRLTQYLIERGAEEVMFAAVASGPNSAVPHHERGSRRLRRGDVVVVDLVASVGGYYGDLTRVFVLGEPPRGFERAYRAVNLARRRVFEEARPGVEAGRLDEVARRVLREHGLLEAVLHRTGHGLGVEVHEPPYLALGNREKLAEGNVFTVEPGVYFQGRFGVRVESVVWLGEKEAVVLDEVEPEPVYL